MEQRQDLKEQDDAVGAGDFVAVLWHSRRMIAAVTVIGMVLGVSGTMYFSKYKSDGFLQFGGPIPLPKERDPKLKDAKDIPPGILLSDYKRYAAAFSTSGQFDNFVQANKLEGSIGIDNLRKVFSSRDGITKLVEPVYPFTKLDAKELMEQPKELSNNVIGLRFSYEANSPEAAQRVVGLLGRYAMDSIVYLIYSDALRFKHTELTARITKLDNEIIENKERLEEYRRRGANLKQIVLRYPESGTQAARQVVTVTEDNARFLSPVTQLMTTEVQASEAVEAIYQAKRQQKQSLLLREYYDNAKTVLDSNKSGEAILRALEASKDAVFKNKDLNDELVKEVYNRISIDNQSSISLYLEKSRFIAGPNLPESRTARLSTTLAMSFLLGLLAACMLVFGRQWWRENRSKLAD